MVDLTRYRLPHPPSRPISDAETAERHRVVTAARSWINTPFHDCACIKGAGVDCAMFLKASFEEAGLESPTGINAYPPQWYMHGKDDLLVPQILKYGDEITQAEALPGDVVLYRFGHFYSHAAIVDEPGWPNIVHAYRPKGVVMQDRGDQGLLAARDRERRFFRRKAWSQEP